MAIFDLLNFSDREIELILTAVRQWSDESGHPLESEEGREALSKAIALMDQNPASADEIVRRLGTLH